MIPEDVEARLGSDDPADRRDAVRALRGWPRRHALPLLLEAVEDEAEEVSGQATSMLVSLATGEAIPALLGQYTRPDRFPGTYVYDVPYYSGLEELGPAGVAAPAVDALAEATDGEIVSRCTILLDHLGDLRARPTLERLGEELGPEEDLGSDDLRAQKARAVSKLLDRLDEVEARAEELPTVDDIRAALESDRYADQETGERRLEEWRHTADRDELLDAVDDPRTSIAEAAATTLGVRGEADAVDALVREVAEERHCIASFVVQYQFAEETDLRHGGHAEALVRIDDQAAVGPLLDALDDVDNAWVAWEIVWVLGLLGDPRAIEAVEQVSDDLEAIDGSGWRYRALVANAERAVIRLQEAAEGEGARG